MKTKLWKLLPLFFCSGLCSLAYELVWMRELRLVFGSSTVATSATLAIFMGGLGLGSLLLAKKVEQHPHPLRLYGYFELIIAISAMLTPFLILFIEYLYLKTGGTQSLGPLLGMPIRLILAALVLGVPTFFMGGTLPAIAKFSTNKIDVGRRDLGFLYGINTLGAVTGVWLVIFTLLENLGSRNTLLAAGLLNLFVGGAAIVIARYDKYYAERPSLTSADADHKLSTVAVAQPASPLPPYYVYGAAAFVGFCFFFMELVWYRMLTPLLGGTTYTMGLILAVVLLGIAIGSWGFGVRRYTVRTSWGVLSLICSLEALFMAIPYALGDRIAVLTSLLRPIGTVGMAGFAVGWLFITALVVLPVSIAAGYQFPLLIGLRGLGRQKIARDTGEVYAWNTLGAITGSLIGGMVLLPWFGALHSWQLNIALLALLAGGSIFFSLRTEGFHAFLLIPAGFAVTSLCMLGAEGPTAIWRHSPIGAGRFELAQLSHNEIQDKLNQNARNILWEKDGIEASLALNNLDSLSFVVNGKNDGNVKTDAGTQIMAPLIGAILHPNPQKALVIGLGTGSSTGWLASIDSISRVDTIEIEPDILEVAKRSAQINRNVLENQKVNIIIGDAREALMTSREKYDIIFSEPSNPYRAGIASLYTQEFYQSVAMRLNRNGYFSQWVQGYEVDTQTIKTIYSTLASVFPVVETWETNMNDLIFICSMEETDYSVARLRAKIQQEPFRSALLFTRGITDLEGLMAHYSANSSLARQVAARQEIGAINTDDRMLVEFGFARGLGQLSIFSVMDIQLQAKKRRENRPHLKAGEVDWAKAEIFNHTRFPMEGFEAPDVDFHDEKEAYHSSAFNYYLQGDSQATLDAWQGYGKPPEYPYEILVVADSLAEMGHDLTVGYALQLQNYWPIAAQAVLARYYWRKGERRLAYDNLESVFINFRTNPWPQRDLMRRSLILLEEMAATDKQLAKKIYKLISQPFSLYILESSRLNTLYTIARKLDAQYMADATGRFEPHPPWNEEFLANRFRSYQQTGNLLALKAERELKLYMNYAPEPFVVD